MRIIGPDGSVSVLALIDSGADETLLPRSLADVTGVLIDDSASWKLGGVAGQTIEAAAGEVGLEFTQGDISIRWSGKVAFASFAAAEDEIVILGHIGFLDFVRATFDGAAREVEILPTGSFPGSSKP